MKNCIVSNGHGVAYFGDSVQLNAENNIFFRPGQTDKVYANERIYTADDIADGQLGAGNICENPLFIAPAWGSEGDYHLSQVVLQLTKVPQRVRHQQIWKVMKDQLEQVLISERMNIKDEIFI
jgi:hypothetical protein